MLTDNLAGTAKYEMHRQLYCQLYATNIKPKVTIPVDCTNEDSQQSPTMWLKFQMGDI